MNGTHRSRPRPRARSAIPAVIGLSAALVLSLATPAAAAKPAPPEPAVDLGRAVLPAGDGWASWSGQTNPDGKPRTAQPTTGGAAAAASEVYVVDTWQELRDALAGKPGGSQNDARYNQVPRIVYVTGTIDPWVTAGGRLTCEDIEAEIAVPGGADAFAMADYIDAFGPGIDPSGPLEQARVAAAARQAQLTLQHIGSNVTLVGVGDDARIVGASLRIRDAHNVIVRNLTLSDAYDCFPQWDANDAGGNWNSAYDNLSIWSGTSVWVDHNTFDDGDHPPTSLPVVYGRPYEVHDGLIDITHGGDLVTMSWNWLQHHDKTDLIGSSDSRTIDRGQHRVTQHHNRWTDIGQRAPRVRYGDVHVYNNLYEQTDAALYETAEGSSPFFQYYWGAGRESSIVAEQNAVELIASSPASRIVAGWGGTELSETGTLVNGQVVDVLAAFNATATTPLAPTARWNPDDHYASAPQPAAEVAGAVRAGAGAGILRSGSASATAAPGRFVLSHDNGWDTGLRDGDYRITANLWWGQNATVVKLYRDGTLVDARWLDDASPRAQRATFDVAGQPNGSATYTLVALNPHGETTSAPLTVEVTDAAPGRAVLSAKPGPGGALVVTSNLWWGTNATEYVLLMDGAEVDRQVLVAATPAAQTASTSLAGLAPGTYVFTAALVNGAGSTETAPLSVTIP